MAKKRVESIRAEIEEERRTTAAVMLQKNWKGYKARQHFVQLLKDRDRIRETAATAIQKTWRAFSARKRYCETLSKIILIQSLVRSFLRRSEFERKRKAAILVQSVWRGFADRKRFTKTVRHIVIVQSNIRR